MRPLGRANLSTAPLDITHLLDELARTNQTDYGGKLNFAIPPPSPR